MKATLKGYQRTGVEFIKNVPRTGLFLDVGLGKNNIGLTGRDISLISVL